MSWSAYSIYNKSQHSILYDPFEVLGISPGASEKTVKRAYKVMSLKWHPDKAKDEKGKESNNIKFIEINKAYKTLTDETSRKNWEEYGNPDGPTTYSLGIALPSWLVDSRNAFWVLALYGLGFGVLVPFLVSRSWNSSKKYTKDNILQSTMALFFKDLKPKMSMKELIEVLAQAEEFEPENNFNWKTPLGTDETEKLFNFVKAATVYNDKFEVSTTKSRKMTEIATRVHCYLFCQFHRIELPNESWKYDQILVVTKAVHLISGMLQIALVRDWSVTSINSITLTQFLIQAVWENQPPILQLPYFTAESAATYLSSTKKPSIRDILTMSEKDRIDALSHMELSPGQIENMINVAKSFPDCNILNVEFKILGQEEITPEGVITCLVKLKLNRLEDSMKLDMKKESEKAKKEKIEIEQFAFDEDGNMIEAAGSLLASKDLSNSDVALQPVHAPFYPLQRKPSWWLFLLSPDLQSFICPPLHIKDLYDEKSVTMQFQTPPRPGQVTLRLMLRSDCLYGADLIIDAKFTIHKESKVQKVVDSDWDISDTESQPENPFGQE